MIDYFPHSKNKYLLHLLLLLYFTVKYNKSCPISKAEEFRAFEIFDEPLTVLSRVAHQLSNFSFTTFEGIYSVSWAALHRVKEELLLGCY